MIIAKHRNGPIGPVALAFQARYPRFTTHGRERTAASRAAPPNGTG